MSFPGLIYGAEKDIYEQSTVQLYPLGQKLITPNGSIFRYTLMGGVAGVANKIYQSEAPTSGWASQALATATAVGDTSMLFKDNAAAFAANLFQGGTVLIEETDDLGHLYRIKTNDASAGTAEARLYFEDGVTVKVAVAVAAGNVATVMKNPWRDIVICPITAPTAVAVGIPRVIITNAQYGWLQTQGVASCLVSGTMVVGRAVSLATAVTGALGPARANGTGTIANLATTATVTHGLGGTPVIGNIQITGAENATNALTTGVWVDTIGATTFVVNRNDPGVSAYDFGWSASLATESVGFCVEVAPTGDFGHIFLSLE